MGEASPVFPGEWPLTFPRTEGGGRSPPHGGGRSGQGVVAGKKRKVRRAAVKAVFFPTRQAACRACPLIRAAGDVRGERDDAARRRASVPGAQAADGQAIVTGIGGDGRRPASCPGIERGRPERAVAHQDIEEDHHHGKTPVSHEAPENPTAQLGSAGFLRLATAHRHGRFAAAAAAPSSRRCGWKTGFITAKQSEQGESVG